MVYVQLVSLYKVALLFTLISCAFCELPDYINKCQHSAKDCILKNINVVLNAKYGGDTSIALRQLDPLYMGTIAVDQKGKSAVSVDIKFENSNLYGISKLTATKIKGFGKSPTGKHQLLLKTDQFKLVSDYTVDGKVLILPVVGRGKSTIIMIEPVLKIVIEGAEKIVNEKLYLDVQNSQLDIQFERMTVNFENLFNGDKALGDNVNKFINENWKEIYEGISAPVLEKFKEVLESTIKDVFNSIPYNELWQN